MRIRLLLAAAAVSVALSSPAHAHLGVESSDPGNASTLKEAPDVATITFDGDVDIETAAARLRYLGEVDTPLEEATRRDVRTESLTPIEASGRTVVFDLPELGSGLYAIDWAVNEAGGHDNSSFILFKVTGSDCGSGSVYLVVGGAAVVGVGIGLLIVRRRSGR
jgi:methionine-rich copper-binding protein CopC